MLDREREERKKKVMPDYDRIERRKQASEDRGTKILFFLIIIPLFVLCSSSTFLVADDWNESFRAKEKCLEFGYSDMHIDGDHFFCTKLKDGNEIIVSLESLEGPRKGVVMRILPFIIVGTLVVALFLGYIVSDVPLH